MFVKLIFHLLHHWQVLSVTTHRDVLEEDTKFPHGSIRVPTDQSQDSIMFTRNHSALKTTGYEGSDHLNISLELRTFEQNSLLLRHKFISGGYFQMNIETGLVVAHMMVDLSKPAVTIHSYTTVSDGHWHRVGLVTERGTEGARLVVDAEVRMKKIPSNIRTGGS